MSITLLRDLRQRFGVVRDQGPRPTCLVFAASDAHAAFRLPWAPLSCEFLFYHAQRRQQRTPDTGATMPGIIDALLEDGQPIEADWPYLAATPQDVASWNPPAIIGATFHCRAALGLNAIDHIIEQLNGSKPCIILMHITPTFFSATEHSLIDEDPATTPGVVARHAVVAVGHGLATGKRCLLVRNSWGIAWGFNGHAWVAERYLAKQVFGLGIVLEAHDVSRNPATT